MIVFWDEIVPAHMRDFQRRIIGRDRDDFAGKPIQAFMLAVLVSGCDHHLHANADAEIGLALFQDGALQGFAHMRYCVQACHAIAKSPLAGEDNVGGVFEVFGVLCHDRFGVFRRDVFEGFMDAVQVAGADIDDCELIAHGIHCKCWFS